MFRWCHLDHEHPGPGTVDPVDHFDTDCGHCDSDNRDNCPADHIGGMGGRSAAAPRDGLGPLDFGTPTATAMETLIELLGPPTPGNEYPYGGHPLRHVYWDDIGLSVIFSDYQFHRDDGLEHLAGWGLRTR